MEVRAGPFVAITGAVVGGEGGEGGGGGESEERGDGVGTSVLGNGADTDRSDGSETIRRGALAGRPWGRDEEGTRLVT